MIINVNGNPYVAVLSLVFALPIATYVGLEIELQLSCILYVSNSVGVIPGLWWHTITEQKSFYY